MRIIGIDPGYAIVGYGVLDYEKTRFSVVNYGAITTAAGTSFDRRLMEIYDDMCTVLDMFKPDCMSIEKLYFTNNKTTGIDVAQARGIILLTAVQRDIEIYEYTPMQVKQAVVGYGKAEKHQVQEMVKAADKLSAHIKCLEELKAGNGEFRAAAEQTRAALDKMDLPELKYFCENFLGSFALTLDEME